MSRIAVNNFPKDWTKYDEVIHRVVCQQPNCVWVPPDINNTAKGVYEARLHVQHTGHSTIVEGVYRKYVDAPSN